MTVNLLPEFDDLKKEYYSKHHKNSEPISEFWFQDLGNRAKQVAKDHGFLFGIPITTGFDSKAKPYLLGIRNEKPDLIIWLHDEKDAEMVKEAYGEYFRFNWFHDEITGYQPEDLIGIAVNKYEIPVSYYVNFMDVERLTCTQCESHRGQYYEPD